MTPDEFIAKWKGSTLSESQAAQSHFNDLCAFLDEPTPAAADPKGEWFCFERGATKTTGGEGWADVWKRGHFGWEYKGKRKDLTAAFVQLQQYALALENPPLLVVSDMETFIIRTNWTNAVSETFTLTLDDLRDPKRRGLLKAVLSDPERLRSANTRQALTEQAAGKFAELAARLRTRGHAPDVVAHFVNRLVFCLFADDVGLLPPGLFDRLLNASRKAPARFPEYAARLFRAMKDPGGEVDFTPIEWFNGGLFDDDAALPLTFTDLDDLQTAARLDWAEIDPSIFGTLFERGLDPDKRSQLGAHYTDRDKIELIIQPVVVRPLLREWEAAKAKIVAAKAKEAAATTKAVKNRAHADATQLYRGFLDRLRAYRVLDPACGSGNFLYLALIALKNIEHQAGLEAEALGLQREFPQVGPEVVLGIELNPYAAELARISVWIGAIQWAQRNAMPPPSNPILKPLHNIACRDSVLAPDGSVADWPAADSIIGNPPFLGGNAMIGSLGESYVAKLRHAYAGRVPGSADLVCYWFDKAREAVATAKASRCGLVATQAIRTGASRSVLDGFAREGVIFDAWTNEPWTVEGADVRVSLVCFAKQHDDVLRLNGVPVPNIHPDLSSGITDITAAREQPENSGACLQGFIAAGPFDVSGETARDWLRAPANPNGRRNADVLRPWIGARDVMQRPSDTWIIDFNTISEAGAAMYVAPFKHVVINVKPLRDAVRRKNHREGWWLFGENRPGLRMKIGGMSRVICTPKVSRHRVFVWLPTIVSISQQFYIITRDDDTAFGILHSRFHEAWTLARASWHGVGNDPSYTPTATFNTFPFPAGMTPNLPASRYAAEPKAQAIADAARKLTEMRDRWLYPPELVQRVSEVVPGYPDRITPKDAAAAEELAKRTMTALYNTRGKPAGVWLDNLHAALDAAVAAAYGWPKTITNNEAIARLMELNHARAAANG